VLGQQLPESELVAPDVVEVDRAVDLAALPALADDPTPPHHPQVPGDPRLAHPEVAGQLVGEIDDRLQLIANPGEVGGVLAWLASVASIAGVDLDQAASRYAHGCPRCGAIPCACPPR